MGVLVNFKEHSQLIEEHSHNLLTFLSLKSVAASAEGRVEHQKRNQTATFSHFLSGRLVSFLVFNSITHVGKLPT